MDLNLTSEQLEILECLTEEQKDVFKFAVTSKGLEIEDALEIAENEKYCLFESVRELVNFQLSEEGYDINNLPEWLEINYRGAWFGELEYDWEFMDDLEKFKCANRYEDGIPRYIWESQQLWQIKNSRVISLDF